LYCKGKITAGEKGKNRGRDWSWGDTGVLYIVGGGRMISITSNHLSQQETRG
jgi:hypothetical protein